MFPPGIPFRIPPDTFSTITLLPPFGIPLATPLGILSTIPADTSGIHLDVISETLSDVPNGNPSRDYH